MSRDEKSFLSLPDAAARRLREDDGTGSAVPLAYVDGNGRQLSISGDKNFPFVMVPPDLGEATSYFAADRAPGIIPTQEEGNSIYSPTALQDFEEGPVVDVRGLRNLTFYLSLHMQAEENVGEALNNVLAVIPQVANGAVSQYASPSYKGANAPYPTQGRETLTWFSLGVVDPVLRGAWPTVTNPPTVVDAPSYAGRYVQMTALYLPYRPRQIAPLPSMEIHTTLVFDVAPYEYFRLRWARTYLTPPAASIVYPPGNADVGGQLFSLFLQGQR